MCLRPRTFLSMFMVLAAFDVLAYKGRDGDVKSPLQPEGEIRCLSCSTSNAESDCAVENSRKERPEYLTLASASCNFAR